MTWTGPAALHSDLVAELMRRLRAAHPQARLVELFTEAAVEVIILARGTEKPEVKLASRRGACLRVLEKGGGTLWGSSRLNPGELRLAAGRLGPTGKPGSGDAGTPEMTEVGERVRLAWAERTSEAARESAARPGISRSAVLFRGLVRWSTVTSEERPTTGQVVVRLALGVSCFAAGQGPARQEIHVHELMGHSFVSSGGSCLNLENEPTWANQVGRIARATADRAATWTGATGAPHGRMPVVIAGPAGTALIHEACGHGLEADVVVRGGSPFAGQYGQGVADSVVTIVDDPTLGGGYGSYDFDDEGVQARRVVLVEEGRLVAFLGDFRTAPNLPGARVGNARRASFLELPLPRMSNTFLLPGPTRQEDMIASLRKGLFVEALGSGRIDSLTGRFDVDVARGRVIRSGTLGEPVTGARLSGSGPELLRSIRAVGSDLGLGPGRCSKEGSVLEVMGGGPSVLIEEMEVAGR